MTEPTENLHRELGFWPALTIGVGTMVGAGIFLLSGVAITLTGPAAVFSYLVAGVVCIITAASTAELATGMPTSGGTYYFVSRSLGPVFGAVAGIGVWISLTFAIAFYLLGTGEYLAEFLPLTPFWGALLAGVLFTALNVIGAKESGGVQVLVVLILLSILGIFTLFGLFNIQTNNLTPFLPFGTNPILPTTALIFVSFLGFVKISAVSEEIKEPAKNLPRTLIGSVALVTIMYVLVVLVVAGMFPQSQLADIRSPLTRAAEIMFGKLGGAVMIFAGLLATLSSANASIMAASRINLAMARDRLIPRWLSRIHPKRLTPYRAILITGALALSFLLTKSLEELAEIASVLQLYGYAAINMGVVFLRVASPEWYKPSYRAPGSPLIQAFAAIASMGIILYSGIIAQAITVGLIAISLIWYFWWGASRVKIEYGFPQFRVQLSQLGWQVFFQPVPRLVTLEEEVSAPALRASEPNTPRRVMVALANPEHEPDLLRLGRYIATGQNAGGQVFGVHLVRVPMQTSLHMARDRFAERPSIERNIAMLAEQAKAQPTAPLDGRPLAETEITAVTDVAHDVFGALVSETARLKAGLLLMGWQGGFNISHIYNSPVQRIMSSTQADVAVLKNRGLEKVDSILVPWGGGMHALLGLEIAVRIACSTGAAIHLLRIVKPSVDPQREKQTLPRSARTILGDFNRIHYLIQQHESVSSGLQTSLDARQHDMVIIGASEEWRIRNVLFGSIPDLVADYANCSVLMVRRYLPDHWSVKATTGIKRIKESVGLTTSPENNNRA